jgi:REP element-mobilizing transposase RayT
VLIAGGIANHVHMLIVLPVDVPIAKAVQIFKANRRAGYRNTRLSSRGRRATGRSA